MKTIKLICECGKEFSKPKKEYDYQIKAGRKRFFCSRSCAGKYLVIFNVSSWWKTASDNEKTEATKRSSDHHKCNSYRTYLRRVRTRLNRRQVDYASDLTSDYLREVFEKQGGHCVYTNIKLNHPTSKGYNDPIRTASLDRIDSSKNYQRGNVQFISICMNYAKNIMSHEKTIEFVNEIRRTV